MIIHDLVQGSPEWHEFRANHHGASDAPAMMGKSKHQSRTELIESKKFGAQEVGYFTQKIFDKGHAFEETARPIAEEIIGEELYPVVGSLEDTWLSASFDGLTMDHSIVFEHKQWSEELAKEVEDYKNGRAELHSQYIIQMDQQLLVSGAEKALFMVSDGTKNRCVWAWYYGSDNFDYLFAGWGQFEKDLAEYKPAPTAEPVEIKSIDDLPAIKINVTGMVQSSNLKLYADQAQQFIDSINTDLQTDEDFGNAERIVKFCKSAEDEIETAKKAALSQTADIDQLFKTIDAIKEGMRSKRLELNKLVKNQKEQIRKEIIQAAQNEMGEHLQESSRQVGMVLTTDANFVAAIKGKKTIKSLRDACSTELARAKIAVNEQAGVASANLKAIPEDYKFLFNDFALIALKSQDDFANLVDARVEKYKRNEAAKAEAERERIRKEEAEKAKEQQPIKEQATANNEPPFVEVSKPAEPASIYTNEMQLTAMYVEDLGFLPLITLNNKELYRGEHQSTAIAAIQKCENFLRNQ